MSIFRGVKASKSHGPITLVSFAKDVRDGAHRKAVESYRTALMLEDPDAEELKRALTAVTLSGVVTTGGRANAMEQGRFTHNGLLQVDIDHVENPGQVRDMLQSDPHIAFASISPSGDGVKAVMLIPVCKTKEKHLACFEAMQDHMKETYDITIDASTSDSARLCFVLYDPEAKWNAAAVPLVIPEPQAAPPQAAKPKVEDSPKSPKIVLSEHPQGDWTLDDLDAMLTRVPAPPKGQHQVWIDAISGAWNTLGEAATPIMIRHWPEWKTGEYDARFANRESTPTILKIYSMAKAYGWTPTTRQKALAARGLDSEAKAPQAGGEADLPEVELTPFPTHCLPGAAGDMAREIGRVTTAQNEPLAAASVLAIVSAAIGAGIEVSTGGERRTRGNLFVLAIAESGTGKGETYSIAGEPFEALEAEAIEIFDMHTKPGLLAEINVAEARAKTLCKDAAKETDTHARILSLTAYRQAEEERADIQRRIDSAPRWKVADVTKEALAVVMAGQPGEAVASLSSEARGIFSIVKGRYGKEGGDEDLYCSAYSGDSINVDRMGRARVTLRRPCLSILWMVQPDAARKAFNEESFTDSGLLPRFLTFDPKAEPQERYEQPAPIPTAIKAGWETLIRSLATTYRMNGDEPQTVSVSREALAAITDYERENVRRRRRDGDLVDLAPFVARWTENAWKLALVLHSARHGSGAHEATLEAGTAADALEVMRWFAGRQLEVLQSGRREKLQKRLMALMAAMAAAKNEISFRDLKRSHSFEESEIRQLKAVFPKAFKIEERRAGPQRTSAVIMPL
jgi:hypothetical protein